MHYSPRRPGNLIGSIFISGKSSELVVFRWLVRLVTGTCRTTRTGRLGQLSSGVDCAKIRNNEAVGRYSAL